MIWESVHLPQDAPIPHLPPPLRGACLVVPPIPGIEPPIFRQGHSPSCSYHRFPAHFAPSSPSSSTNPTSVFRICPSSHFPLNVEFPISALRRVFITLPSALPGVPNPLPPKRSVDTFRYSWVRVLINSPSVMLAVRDLRQSPTSNL